MDPTLAVYVHWPFCRAKCPYCDFNSHVADTIDQAAWAAAYRRAVAALAAEIGPRTVTSVFLGGGTPTLMAPATVAAILDAIAGAWTLAADAEISAEANPTSADTAALAGLAAAGVNRLSLGVQALEDRALAFLGRQHDTAQAIAALDQARRRFPRLSIDLIYARPGQTPEAWAAELNRALAFGLDHLSVYQLTIEAGTAFRDRHARGDFTLPDADTGAALHDTTQVVLDAAGLPAYEISNHARPGAECRHNVHVWRYGAYAGIGPGAHGRLHPAPGRVHATRQHRAPEIWLNLPDHWEQTPIDAAEQLAEAVMMGLRLTAGLDRAGLRASLGVDPVTALAAERLAAARDEGLVAWDANRLWATAEGRLRLDALLGWLLAG